MNRGQEAYAALSDSIVWLIAAYIAHACLHAAYQVLLRMLNVWEARHSSPIHQQAQLGEYWSKQLSPSGLVLCQPRPFVLNETQHAPGSSQLPPWRVCTHVGRS